MFKGLRGRKLIVVIMSVLMLSGLIPLNISANNKTVTVEIGEGHENVAGSFVTYFNEQNSPAVIAERQSEESHVVTLTNGEGELYVKDILTMASESLLAAVDESGFHNNQKPYRVAENDITHYRNKEEVLEEYNCSESSVDYWWQSRRRNHEIQVQRKQIQCRHTCWLGCRKIHCPLCGGR